ncbi:MAG: hypothetical protein DRJ10_20835, partial [Bacteroidetes bacterium]
DIEYFTEIIIDYPKSKLPQDAKEIYIRIADEGQKAQLILKLNDGYKILPFEKSDFSYNYAKKAGAEYRNGFVYVTSIMAYSSNSSTGVFKIAGKNKLIFIKEEYDTPNDDIETSAEDALAKGDIKTAAELYLETTYPPLDFYEVTQKKLLKRAHEVALKQFKAKEYTKAAETMGYAYDFYDIDVEADMYFDKKMISILADYTYFLEKAKMYHKCIKVAEAFTFTVIDVAGPYMHLGDSYYHTNEKQKALEAYKEYSALRIKQGAEKRIPSYVKTRIAELDTKAKITTEIQDEQEISQTQKKGFVIVSAGKNYEAIKKQAKSVAEKLGYKLNLRDLEYNKTEGLTFSKEICENENMEFPAYISSGRWDDGEYVSVEYTNAYDGFTPDYYILVVSSHDKGNSVLKAALTHVKKQYKTAYIKYADVYMGGMH